MDELVLLKLGGSVITDKTRPFTARKDVIARLGEEIAGALEKKPGLRLIVGHGSGSFGHQVAHRYQTHLGNIGPEGWRGFAETARSAAQLHRIVLDTLYEAGVPVLSVQPSASAQCHAGALMSLSTHIMNAATASQLVPVVYGDVAVDSSLGFTIISTEKIFDYLCAHLDVSRIILAGIVDGVFDGDPLKDPKAKRYSDIRPADWEKIQRRLGGSYATDVTGGMASKVQQMLDLVKRHSGVTASIVSGKIPGNVERWLENLSGQGGTTIRSNPKIPGYMPADIPK
jgi:isopentenyl phosphate kinase